MAGSNAPKGLARLLVEAAPALRRGFKAPPRPRPSAAAARQVPPSRSLATTARSHDEGRDSDEKIWRIVFVVGGVTFFCRIMQVLSDKYADVDRAREESIFARAELREKDDAIRRLEWMLKVREQP
ncbi:unnamed protein product [Urochloa humidicola]